VRPENRFSVHEEAVLECLGIGAEVLHYGEVATAH